VNKNPKILSFKASTAKKIINFQHMAPPIIFTRPFDCSNTLSTTIKWLNYLEPNRVIYHIGESHCKYEGDFTAIDIQTLNVPVNLYYSYMKRGNVYINSIDFEVSSFLRYYYLHEFVNSKQINRFITMDEDTLISYIPIDPVRCEFSGIEFLYNFAFWSLDFLNKFLNKITSVIRTYPDNKLVECNFINDMSLLRAYNGLSDIKCKLGGYRNDLNNCDITTQVSRIRLNVSVTLNVRNLLPLENIYSISHVDSFFNINGNQLAFCLHSSGGDKLILYNTFVKNISFESVLIKF
jgi:hypothetical protein